jgi:hypothetical protein
LQCENPRKNQMKFLKPAYNSQEKQYTSKVEDGVRLTAEQEGGGLRPTPQDLKASLLPVLIPTVVETTKGWFTKPLTQEWLETRCELSLPMPEETFEGSITWVLQDLIITKEKFRFLFSILEAIPAEKVVIQLEEEEEPELVQEVPPVALDPTRRVQHKQKVLRARAKAARALFKAERMTQEYIETYGEDTDWEDEESGVESS